MAKAMTEQERQDFFRQVEENRKRGGKGTMPHRGAKPSDMDFLAGREQEIMGRLLQQFGDMRGISEASTRRPGGVQHLSGTQVAPGMWYQQGSGISNPAFAERGEAPVRENISRLSRTPMGRAGSERPEQMQQVPDLDQRQVADLKRLGHGLPALPGESRLPEGLADQFRQRNPLPPPPQSGGNDMAQSTRPGGYQSFGNPNNTPASQSGGVAMRGFGGSQAGGGLPPPPQGGGFTGGGQAGPTAQTAAGSPVNVRAPQAGGGFTGYQTLEQQQQNGPLGDIGRARINGLAGGQAPPPLPTLGGLPAGGARPTGIQPIPPGGSQPQPLPGGGYQRPATKPQPFADTPGRSPWNNQGAPPGPPVTQGGGQSEPPGVRLGGAPAGVPRPGGGPQRAPAPTQDIYEPGQGAAQGGNMGGPPGPPVTQGGREPQLGAPAPINRVPGGVQSGGGTPPVNAGTYPHGWPTVGGGQQPGLGHAGPGGQPPVRPFPGAVGGGQQPPMPIRPIGGYGEGYGGTGGIQPPPPLSQVPPALQPFLPPGYGQRPQAPAPASAGPPMPQRPNIPPWFMR